MSGATPIRVAEQSAIKTVPHSTARTILRWALPIALGVLLRIAPTPTGLSPNAWHYFALFAAVIAALVTEPLPGPAVGLIAISIATLFMFVGNTPVEAVRWALSGFSNDTVWLIFAATVFAIGYEATGLGRRIALLLVKWLGKRTLGLGYAVAMADLALAPFMPSNTARSGGTIYPVLKNIPPLYGSLPGESSRKIGSYLMWTGFAITNVTSSMFLTALAPNLLAIEIARKVARVDITWSAWMLGFLPVGLLLFAATPLLSYILYPPEIKRGAEVVRWAKEQLASIGRISRREVTMAILALLALGGWIKGGRWMAPVSVALIVISLMLLTKVITWNDIAANKQAWGVLVWFATLVTMADALNSVGFLKWFADRTTTRLANVPQVALMIGLVAVFFYIHYLFASSTAHTAAVLPVFLTAVLTVKGLPIRAVALILMYSLGLFGVISPYATGPAPIWYGSGYIPTKDFWRMGFIMGFIFILVLLTVGLPWVLHFAK
jgi:L-tartrate/succinate antiporter